MKNPLVAMISTFAYLCSGFADSAGYGGQYSVKTERDGFVFRHEHNWGGEKYELFKDPRYHDRFFTAENDFSHVEAVNDSGDVIFRSPSPALTNLAISPDLKFFVGISNIKLANPYQIVVWDRSGQIRSAIHLSGIVAKLTEFEVTEINERFADSMEFLTSDRFFEYKGDLFIDFMPAYPRLDRELRSFLWDRHVSTPYSEGIVESVSNWVFWFDRDDPEIELRRRGESLLLSVRSESGKRIEIPMVLSKPTEQD